MITLEHVSKTYAAGVPALNDVSLEIEDGEFVFVVGDSGSGKSTLIKLLLKELEPTEGSITIAGKKLGKIRRKQIPKFRRNIGVVFQDFRLLKDRNVYDNVAFAQKWLVSRTAILRKKYRLCFLWWDLPQNTVLFRNSYPEVSSREWRLPVL